MFSKNWLTFVCCTLFSSLACAYDWTEFGGNSQHTGYQPVMIKFTKITRSLYLSEFSNAHGSSESYPVVVNGIVYLFLGMEPLSMDSDQIIAVDPTNGGKILWQTVPGCSLSNITAVDNILYAPGAYNCFLLNLINISNGKIIKKINVNDLIVTNTSSNSSDPTNDIFMWNHSTFYSFNQDGTSPVAYKLSPDFYAGHYNFNNPLQTISDKYLVFYNDSGSFDDAVLNVFDRKTGKLDFSIINPRKEIIKGYSSNLTTIILDDKLVAGLDGYGYLEVYNLDERKISYSLKGYYSHIAADDKYIYAERGVDGCPVDAIDKNTGVVSWSFGHVNADLNAEECMMGDIIVTNNLLIVGGEKRTFVISKVTHNLLGIIPEIGHMALSNNKLYILSPVEVDKPHLSEYTF